MLLSVSVFDIYIAAAYGIISALAAIICVEIKRQRAPTWTTVFTSVINMVIWALAVKKSSLSMVQLSAIFDVVGALAYFVGFAIYGEVITFRQWMGIILMVFSLLLINK